MGIVIPMLDEGGVSTHPVVWYEAEPKSTSSDTSAAVNTVLHKHPLQRYF